MYKRQRFRRLGDQRFLDRFVFSQRLRQAFQGQFQHLSLIHISIISRQVICCIRKAVSIDVLLSVCRSTPACSHRSVSYTHLDVYKRQAMNPPLPVFPTLLLEAADGIATLTLNQPATLNAIDVAMARDLQRCLLYTSRCV